MPDTKSVKISSDAKIHQKEKKEAIILLKQPVHWGIEDSSENIDKYI